MNGHSALLARYKHLRTVGRELNNQLVASLSTASLREGGKKLGILRGDTFVLPSENMSAVLMDYCLHDVWRKGKNAIEQFLENSPPAPDSDEMLILQAKRDAFYSWFIVEETETGVGVQARDLVGGQSLFIMDVGFGTTANKGGVISARIASIDGMNTSTGASLPVTSISRPEDGKALETVMTELRVRDIPLVSRQEASDIIGVLIRALLATDRPSQMAYLDPDEIGAMTERHASWENGVNRFVPELAHAAAPSKELRIGRNDRCPCGSGKKFKHCCNGRR